MAQDAAQPAPSPPRALVIGTKEAPPFAMKDANGEWEGLSIELWRRVAGRLRVPFRFEEASLDELISGTQAHRFDAALAAITVTPERERQVDFSQPYFVTGLGIAVPVSHGGRWWPIVRSLLSFEMLTAVGALGLLLLAVGFVTWAIERRTNPQFKPGLKGIGDGFWWSAVTMTTVGYGDKSPVTRTGRLLGVVWMFASVILISSFTAAIATALTTGQLQGLVRGPADLGSVRVGVVRNSSGAAGLQADHVAATPYDSAQAGLDALSRGEIDAFVYDDGLLRWLVKDPHYASFARVLNGLFERQTYAVALPDGSPYREALNEALLEEVQSQWWRQTQFRYLGTADN